jgi:hypothetical protein
MDTVCRSHVKMQRLLLRTLSVFNDARMSKFSWVRSSDSLLRASVSDSDVRKATRRLRQSKSVGLDGIPAFIIKGCLDVLIPVLKFIFNLSLSQCIFLTLWKQASFVPILKTKDCHIK